MAAKRSRRRFLCLDCGVDTGKIHEYYFLHTRLWLTVVPTRRGGMLCVGCFEARLGRKLVRTDFNWSNITNDVKRAPKSARLMERMAATKPNQKGR